MADVLNKNTMQLLKSVHTPLYSADEWLINPVLPACAKKYWKIKTGAVVEMTATEKKTVDDAEAAHILEAQKAELITNKLRDIAIEELKTDGVLDSNGDIIGG